VIGISTSGASIGGLCFPMALQYLIPSVGFAWSIRILALIVFLCLMISSITIRSRIPLSRNVSLRDAVDFHGFKDRRYALVGIAAFL